MPPRARVSRARRVGLRRAPRTSTRGRPRGRMRTHPGGDVLAASGSATTRRAVAQLATTGRARAEDGDTESDRPRDRTQRRSVSVRASLLDNPSPTNAAANAGAECAPRRSVTGHAIRGCRGQPRAGAGGLVTEFAFSDRDEGARRAPPTATTAGRPDRSGHRHGSGRARSHRAWRPPHAPAESLKQPRGKRRPPTGPPIRSPSRAGLFPPFGEEPLELASRDQPRAPLRLHGGDCRDDTAVERSLHAPFNVLSGAGRFRLCVLAERSGSTRATSAS